MITEKLTNPEDQALALFSLSDLTTKGYKEQVTKAEEALLKLPQIEPEVSQQFLPGLYSRTIIIPKGMILTGGVHKTDSLIFVSSGKLIVATEDGNITIEAPASFIGRKGTKRIAYCLEECTWTNVHEYHGSPLNTDDMKHFIVCDTYKDYEIYLAQEDYRFFLAKNNWTDLEVVQMVIQTEDIVDFDEATNVEVKPSKISCNGAFATVKFKAGERVGKGSIGLNRTLLTRFTNHSNRPNISVALVDDDLVFRASVDIDSGSEILADYSDIVKIRRQL